MNYMRVFHGMKPLTKKLKTVEFGDLKNIYTGEVFCKAWVDSYNLYINDYNRSNYRASQEFYLDQKHRFFVMCMSIQGA